jgi:hypothetical protein
MFKSKLSLSIYRHSEAQADEKLEDTWDYVGILKRLAS